MHLLVRECGLPWTLRLLGAHPSHTVAASDVWYTLTRKFVRWLAAKGLVAPERVEMMLLFAGVAEKTRAKKIAELKQTIIDASVGLIVAQAVDQCVIQ